MTVPGGGWRRQAMAWPLISGAVCGIYVAWQFADPGFMTRLLGVVLGALCSLPAGALLGVIAILVGHSVLAFIPQHTVDHRLTGWRLAFGAATGLAVALVAGVALVWLGVDGTALPVGGAVGTIAFVASCVYFPESELRTVGALASPPGQSGVAPR